MSKEIEIKVPTNWNDITIGMYQKFQKVVSSKKMTTEEKNVRIVSILCGIKAETLINIRHSDIRSVVKSIMKLVDDKPNTDKLVKRVKFNEKVYGFIPNIKEISMGEYVDIETLCKNASKNLHKIMAILYRPIIKDTKSRYSIEPYVQDEYVNDEFKNFPMFPSLSALNFFFLLGKKLPFALNSYSLKMRLKKMKEIQLQASGVGTT